MANDDFVMTLESDDESSAPTVTLQKNVDLDSHMNPEFSFDVSRDTYVDILHSEKGAEDHDGGGKLQPVSIDDIIARRRPKLSMKRKRQDASEDESDNDSISHEADAAEAVSDGSDLDAEEEDPLATSDEGSEDEGRDIEELSDAASDAESSSSDDTEPETQAEKERKASFFSESTPVDKHSSFLAMNLSRPILKALTSLGFHTPTPIQAATIPVGLLGKDVVGNAVTGSGKTAAFIIPMLERLLYRDRGKKAAATRCLVLVPTRELAAQCFEVGTKLAAHTDVQFCLVVGGLSLKVQEAALRNRPDVLIATPGRLIDHIRNSPSFTLDALDVLVLDEADRMLSEGFHDELTEIIRSCPTSRQTMLFSATMTDSVDELVKMSLNRPVRLFVDPKRTTARGLIQEFVRVRAGKEDERPAILVTICKKVFKAGVIVFYRSKKLAHQMRIVFGLLGMSCEELHGDLTQEQRMNALQSFRAGRADYLMATDLASRGLDIKGVNTVINYDMPSDFAQYLHRVGRTARAGQKGRAVTLVGEGDRRMLKAAVKQSTNEDQVRHRVVPPETVGRWVKELEAMKKDVAAILDEEKEERQLRKAEMELKKGQNLIEHDEEIHSRPARTWFQSGKEKAKAQALGKQTYEAGFSGQAKNKAVSDEKKSPPKRDKFAGLTRKAKRRKMAMEEDEPEDRKAVGAAIRSAKKAARPPKIGEPEKRTSKSIDKKRKRSNKIKTSSSRRGATFDKEMGQTGAKREGVRAKKGNAVGAIKNKGAKQRKK